GHHDPRALGLDHDSGVLRGGDGAAERRENHEDERAHSGHPGWGACHPATLRGGSRPSRRIRRYRLARSVASLRAASATLPRAADSARAMSVRSKPSSASASATSLHPSLGAVAEGAPSKGTTRATSSAVTTSLPA